LFFLFFYFVLAPYTLCACDDDGSAARTADPVAGATAATATAAERDYHSHPAPPFEKGGGRRADAERAAMYADVPADGASSSASPAKYRGLAC
jgi:hypothetical protein